MDVRFWCINFFNPQILAMVELWWKSLLGHFICYFSFFVYFAWFLFICNHIEKVLVVALPFQSSHWPKKIIKKRKKTNFQEATNFSWDFLKTWSGGNFISCFLFWMFGFPNLLSSFIHYMLESNSASSTFFVSLTKILIF
jgi:hypothetical protein